MLARGQLLRVHSSVLATFVEPAAHNMGGQQRVFVDVVTEAFKHYFRSKRALFERRGVQLRLHLRIQFRLSLALSLELGIRGRQRAWNRHFSFLFGAEYLRKHAPDDDQKEAGGEPCAYRVRAVFEQAGEPRG